jgi:hypothetical protein
MAHVFSRCRRPAISSSVLPEDPLQNDEENGPVKMFEIGAMERL